MTRYETKKYTRNILVSLLVLFALSYGLFQSRNLVKGPVLTILNPQSGALLADSLATITGAVENAKEVMVNGRSIDIDESGNFRDEVLVSYGYNIVTVKAVDRFGRETEKTLELVYK